MSSRDYEQFYARTYARVLSSVIMASGDRINAEDAVQDAYAKALRKWDDVGGYDAPEAWVTKVAVRQLWKNTRPQRRERLWLEVTVPPMSTPQESAEAREVLSALATLPLNVRAALVLCRVLGWPQQEIAEMFGVPRATIANRILRGQAMLTKLLGMAAPAQGAREPLVPAPRPVAQWAIPEEDPLNAALARTLRWLHAGIEAEPRALEEARARIESLADPAVSGRRPGGVLGRLRRPRNRPGR
jgi:RNA polymerase sigma-70 factor (ECF subfamily)